MIKEPGIYLARLDKDQEHYNILVFAHGIPPFIHGSIVNLEMGDGYSSHSTTFDDLIIGPKIDLKVPEKDVEK